MKKRGFTLLELVIVVAILMIFAGGGIWTLRGRAQKNEIIKLKTSIPTLLENGTLRIYEKGIKDGKLSVNTGSIVVAGTGIGQGMEIKSSVFTFATSPSSLGSNGDINVLGTFNGNFDILVKDKDSTTILTFSITTKSNLGVYRVDITP